ncbi:MAG: N-6 DNA methylase [Deltaproteobacteria bacterium]|nr:N-6 DNA methylase [Deltaproteobacteria bacterium]
MFDLLRKVTDAIAGQRVDGRPISPDDALSLAGRALFVRFLLDRRILRDEHVAQIAPGLRRVEDLFNGPDRAYATSTWLDETFNGNLLPLPEEGARRWFRRLPEAVFAKLTDILYRAPDGQLWLNLDWQGIHFAHVPVGLLSEVYEAHCQRHHQDARDQSVHYTPRTVAEFMVRESFAAMETPWEAKVLDPAAGAGVFLVAAYRALVAERWQHDGRRPTRAVLRRIIRHQLVGFDINEPALRLGALALYLTALELDPDPTPPQALRFEDLRNTVLFDLRRTAAGNGVDDAGSLGTAVSREHEGRYDLVIGNPPWTAWRRVPGSAQEAVDRVFRARGEAGSATLPDKNPDLAFLWRSMGWAREGGRISLTLGARLLFKQADQGARARDEILRNLHVTGIVNGSALRDTEFWPGMRSPFCFLFAINQRPPRDAACWFVSPEVDKHLNDRGRVRVDADHACPVSIAEARARPWTFKAHFRGNEADRELLARLLKLPALQAWWTDTLGLHGQHQGYQVGSTSGSHQPAFEFHGLPDLRPAHISGKRLLAVDPSELPPFTGATLHRTRYRGLYRAPLVVVPQRIPLDRRRGRAVLFTEDVFFSESFHGWSCAAAPQADFLARYLFLLFNSDVPRYVALLTSGRYGAERDIVLLEDIERLPVRPLDALEPALRKEITPLANAIVRSRPAPWDDLDDWVARAYQLSALDREVIADTLAVSTPEGQGRAQQRPTLAEQKAWCRRVIAIVDPFLVPLGRSLRHDFVIPPDQGSWIVVRFHSSSSPPRADVAPQALEKLLRNADDLAATELVAWESDG